MWKEFISRKRAISSNDSNTHITLDFTSYNPCAPTIAAQAALLTASTKAVSKPIGGKSRKTKRCRKKSRRSKSSRRCKH